MLVLIMSNASSTVRIEPRVSINMVQRAVHAIDPTLPPRSSLRAAMVVLLACTAVGPDFRKLCRFTGYSPTATDKNSVRSLLDRAFSTRILRRKDDDEVLLYANDWENKKSGALGLILDAMVLCGELTRSGDSVETYLYESTQKVRTQPASYSMKMSGETNYSQQQ